jgi:hypothetical protein
MEVTIKTNLVTIVLIFSLRQYNCFSVYDSVTIPRRCHTRGEMYIGKCKQPQEQLKGSIKVITYFDKKMFNGFLSLPWSRGYSNTNPLATDSPWK